ncbi:zinc-finger-containing protein [Thioalkalivibrio sp. ALE19]|uniref:zinc-finger-containing protein n=1 Tax=Thioalkalivibrio sp. ALE19 TaxID=1266909 RepID=UPI00048D820A|nr:zinc-finger-containing protein [Thioalkalivibrio sp. ALE19]
MSRRGRKPKAPLCPYCGERSERVTGAEVYPHRPDLAGKAFYQCAPCDARVGCHPGTNKPLGRLANAALRRAKSRAHKAFDGLWRDGSMTRSEAYAWLAEQMDLPVKRCHIGQFDEAQCEQVVTICSEAIEAA